MKKHIFTSVLLVAFMLPAIAQTLYNGQIQTSSELKQVGDSVYLSIDIDLSNLKLSHDLYMMLTPILTDHREEIVLPYILINGTTRHKVYERGLSLEKDMDTSDIYTVVKADGKNTHIQYKSAAPFRSWMGKATLMVEEDLCGCGGHQQEFYTENLTPQIILEKVVQPEPPRYTQVKEVKEHKEEFDTFVEFPVSKSVIHADFRNNMNELVQLHTGIEKIMSKEDIIVTRIEIVGFASPEGGEAFNQKLSEARAEALRDYVMSKFPALNKNMFSIVYGGEGWDKLENLIESSDYKNKEQILSIIRNKDNIASRKAAMKSITNGVTYQQLLKDVYPKIRRATFNIYYTVRDTVIKDVLEENSANF